MSGWTLKYHGFDPTREGLREALCTLGNGYFATRGAAPEAAADGVHYPGTYLAGGYNRLVTEVSGREVENEDLVNLPNWLPVRFRITGAEWFDLSRVEILEYEQVLHLREGLLERTLRFRNGAGRRTRLRERRLVHMQQPHLAALEISLTAENWSGTVEVSHALDGRVRNAGVARYRELASRHLEPLEARAEGTSRLFLRTRTSQSRIEVALAARLKIFRGDEEIAPESRSLGDDAYVSQEFGLRLNEGEALRLEKVVALCTSRDRAISECGLHARTVLTDAGSFEALRASHALAWEHLWRRFDIRVEESSGGDYSQGVLRLHIFHLLQTASPHVMELDVGVPARGWHGEAYRGHIFWDELFIFPLLNLRLPEVTRSLLLYRYRRLGAARANARQAGYLGAMYPWQSGSDGREESQRLHLNPRSGRWIPDPTELQRHANAAIAYNIWQYYQATRDMQFLSFYGAEVFLEIARFWASVSSYNDSLGRYEIHGVMGPDEFHTGYVDAELAGLNNNAYTNVMAVWVLVRALELLNLLPASRSRELRESLGLDDGELANWERISRRMRIAFHSQGIISQFEGYDALQELDWVRYRRKYGDIHRLDRILEEEGDTPNRYKLSKQADVLMLFYLFSAEELTEIFERLGYLFDADAIPRNVEYYSRRSTHGSTLSRVVHAWVLSRSDRPRSWQFFREALESDVVDIQGGTTREGIHLGAMAGSVDLIQRCYTGMVTRGDVLWLNPCLPEGLSSLELTVRYRGHGLDVRLTRALLVVRARESNAAPVLVGFGDTVYELNRNETRRFELDQGLEPAAGLG